MRGSLIVALSLPLGGVLALAVACSSGSGNASGRNGGGAPDGAVIEGAATGGDATGGTDTGNNPGTDSATGATDGPIAMNDAPTGPGPYPAGPYGNNAGDVLQNLSWDGYVNKTGTVVSTSLTYGPTTLQDLRGDGKGYALIHLSDFY